MNVTQLHTPEELRHYDQWVKSHPQGSLWQSMEWKRYQEVFGRETRLYAAWENENILMSALVIIDRTVGGFSTWDIPRGPLLEKQEENNKWEVLMRHVIRDAYKDRCMSIFWSPIRDLGYSIQDSTFKIQHSDRHEQPEATRMIDLTLREEEILSQMHPKGRYNIKIAQKHGIRIERSTDIEAYRTLAQATASRDEFRIPSTTQLKAFLKLEGSFLLLAYAPHSPAPIAGLMAVIWNGRGIYYYGASDYAHRALMAPYLLQWEAMKECKAQGCTRYDLLGIAPVKRHAEPVEALHSTLRQAPSYVYGTTADRQGDVGNRASRSVHPWSGISAFKEKFGGTIVTYPPEQQILLRPMISRLLQLKRRILG